MRVSFTSNQLDALLAEDDGDILKRVAIDRRELRALVEQARIVSMLAEQGGDAALVVRAERLNVTSRELVELDNDRLVRLSEVIALLETTYA